MFKHTVEEHLARSLAGDMATLTLAENTEGQRQARFAAYHAGRLLTRLRGAQHYWLDVRQAAEFQRGDFNLAELPPLVAPALFVGLNGTLRFNTAVKYFRSPAYVIPEGTPPGTLPPLTPCKEKTTCLYRGVFIHEELPPHTAANYPPERVISVQWFERPERQTVRVGDRWCDATELDNYRISFAASSWPDILFQYHHDATHALEHARRLFHMTVNLLYFLAAENLVFVRVRPEHRGRRELRGLPHSDRPYHVVDFQLPRYRYAERGTGGEGTSHGVRYDVRGHFRHLRDGRYTRNPDGSARVLWVATHQRGLAASVYRPAVRRGAVGARVLDYDELLLEEGKPVG